MFKEANYFTYLGYRLFGERIKRKMHKYYDLEHSLQMAQISMPPEMYIATARMVSLIFAIVGGLLGLLIAIVVVFFIGIPESIFPIAIPESIYDYWMAVRPFIYSLLIVAVIAAVLYFISHMAFTLYPSMIISDRKSKIDRILPHAIMFMYSLTKGGMSLIEVFEALAKNHEVYGEVSREASRIIRDMELLGKDLRTALADAVELSPSENFREFLHGIITILDSGGDITRYLEERAEFYLERSRQDQKNFLEFLGLMAESYITAFVAGPLFLIIIQTVMVVMGQGDETALYAVIYLVIPIGSFFFAMTIKILTPTEEGEAPTLSERFSSLRKKYNPEGHEEELKKLEKRLKSYRIMQSMRHPLRIIKEKPTYTFIFSVPAGLAFMIYGLMQETYAGDIMKYVFEVDDYIFFSLIIMLLPFVIFFEASRRRAKRTLRLTPIFLNKLASANESGMPIYRAISMIAKTDTSPLKKEIQRIKADLDWGISLSDALVRFANRLRVYELSRTVTLLNEALRSTGNVTDVLMISAKDASSAELLRRERMSNMFMYVIIIYISFLVFIGIVYIISTTFLSTLAESAAKVAEGGGQFGMLQSIDVTTYKNIFMHAAVFQGLFAGIVAGVMGEGSISAGVKHSLVMLILGYVLFTIFL